MSIFPNEHILLKKLNHGKVLQIASPQKGDKELFTSMLNDCYKHAAAINAKGKPFPAEPLIMALLLSEHKMIDCLTKRIKFSLHNNNKLTNTKNKT